MKVRGLFDEIDRLKELTELGDPLFVLDKKIDWEIFRDTLKIIQIDRDSNKKSNAGRKPFDVVMMFKVLILQRLYNLSDSQTEFQIKDRRSFERFVSCNNSSMWVPDEKTIWSYREQFKKHGLSKKLFNRFNEQLQRSNLIAKSGQIVDASFVEVPRQRNTRDENAKIKNCKIPDNWNNSKLYQKDIDARWTTHNGKRHFGYKDHISADKKRKFILKYKVTSANIHDSTVITELIDNQVKGIVRGRKVWGDSAYRSEKIDELLKQNGFVSMVHEKGYRYKKLSTRDKNLNRKKSKIRARVEHVFGTLKSMNALFIRTIGIERAECIVGLNNIAYNMKRYCLYVT
jgi:IS5 family transposase